LFFEAPQSVGEFSQNGYIALNIWRSVGRVGEEDAEVEDEFITRVVWGG
jgi:hypothetical protein